MPPDPVVQFGIIGSRDTLVKDVKKRERGLSRLPPKCPCLEMEAAGLMTTFPCLVIRGICDYGDSHINDLWQNYAAPTAAAYARELLESMDGNEIANIPKIVEVLQDGSYPQSCKVQIKSALANKALVKEEVEEIQSTVKDMKLYKWLSPPDPSTNFNNAIKERHKGSGLWLLESQSFRLWKANSEPILWLHGIPGCGKTVLRTSVTERLSKDTTQKDGLAYFYFDFADVKKQILNSAIRSIVFQLSGQTTEGLEVLDHLYNSCNDGREQPSTGRLCLFKPS